ncbi:MAG: PilZ domain-containing protein [Candidatus Sulfotelmatobacter sp.]
MSLTSILVCLDEEAARVLGRVLEELSIGVETCLDVNRAAMRMAQQRFDVAILDCEAHTDVATLLRDTRVSRINDSTLAVAIVHGQESIRELFSLGVNFVLYKPVSYDRALSTLRAARSVMRKDKRRASRAPVHTHATIDYANVEREKATLIDIAHDGMSVQFGKKLPPTNKVYFQFVLPEQTSAVRLSGQVVWQDWNGRAGVQFVDVPKASRRLLDDFLTVSLANVEGDGVSTVTVELELPTPRSESRSERREEKQEAVPVPVRVEPKARQEQNSGETLLQMQSQPEEGNRREETRYACRVGAEVYRTGNKVPTYSCLTDLSAGGCYLEVPLPFPQGTSVEITVRTHDMKLHLRGAVQSSHPGYGMGVAFELKTREEMENVQKLTEFVASTTSSESEK